MVHTVGRGSTAPVGKLLLELCSDALQEGKGYLAAIGFISHYKESCSTSLVSSAIAVRQDLVARTWRALSPSVLACCWV